MARPGPVRRLAGAGRNRLRRVVAGLDVPPVAADPAGYALDPARGLDAALGIWRREVARALCAGRAPDGTGRIGDGPIAGAEAGPRRVLIRLIEEHARHDGPAGPLRERIDGVTGA
ncbi:DinB family protein [Streptomyces sp. NWU49]|uniref:DinB family protein n=1 Tax=Streptomyces sp. NWU49 TaxID=2201153 RepID=UPI00215B2E13|nr:DinB family protein [Streptomyces sp. NWU49]